MTGLQPRFSAESAWGWGCCSPPGPLLLSGWAGSGKMQWSLAFPAWVPLPDKDTVTRHRIPCLLEEWYCVVSSSSGSPGPRGRRTGTLRGATVKLHTWYGATGSSVCVQGSLYKWPWHSDGGCVAACIPHGGCAAVRVSDGGCVCVSACWAACPW